MNVDFVITWVDNNDLNWEKEKRKWEAELFSSEKIKSLEEWYNSSIRYRDWGLLKYWFRGVEKFTPWVNKIHFVTYGHVPAWLNTDNEKINVVKHSDFIPQEYLPTFNSHTIEWNLHRIPGLSEHFVYFNDDMYLIKPCSERDFFRNEMPCVTIGLDSLPLVRRIGHAEIENIKIINDYFDKHRCIKENWKKWFNPINGKQMLKTILLYPWTLFQGIYESHLPTSYLKSSFERVWDVEGDTISKTCANKFRDDGQINHWLVENWQIVTGNACPRSNNFGKMYIDRDEDMFREICRQRYHILCINDYECSEQLFDKDRWNLCRAFESILGEKSEFER